MSERRGSLFWTFAGVFLLVLVAATALQIAVTVGVVRPLSVSASRERADQALAATERMLVALPEPADDREISRTLHHARVPDGSIFQVLVRDGRRMLAERPMPPHLPKQVHDLAVHAGILTATSPLLPQRPDAGRGPDDGPPGPEGQGPPGGGPPDGARNGPPRFESAPPGPEGRDHPAPPADADGAPPLTPRDQRFELLAHRRVESHGVVLGTLVAVATTGSASLWRSADVRTLLLFMPFAMLAAGLAGLLMVRVMVRRLRALEDVAVRVAGGDLSARVAATAPDEIGRLEERFNHMTGNLERARDAVERTDRQRRQLFADITHELATPLTTIRGSVETLLDSNMTTSAEERSAYLDDILAEAKRLELLARDLMDLARLEAGAQPRARSRLDWLSLCRNTLRRFEPRFREMRLKLEWQGPEFEAWVVADGRRLEQVIENLLANALRYVPAGGSVRVAIRETGDASARRYRLEVGDDGPGIGPDDLPHLFERFYRSRAARDDGGTGLGLAIVREIVLQHGGEVHAEPGAGRGVTFVVELPAEA